MQFHVDPRSLEPSQVVPQSSDPHLSLSFLFSRRQQSEEAMALKASTSSKGREVSPEMMEKIIQGKVSKRMSDICLLNQVQTQIEIEIVSDTIQ